MERHGCGGSRLQRRMTSQSSFHFTVKAEGICANVLVALRRPHRGRLPLASSSSFTPLSGLVFKAENQIFKLMGNSAYRVSVTWREPGSHF